MKSGWLRSWAETIWFVGNATDGQRVPRLMAWGRFHLATGRAFMRNRCLTRAAALAFTSLLALIPMLTLGTTLALHLLKRTGPMAVENLVNHIVSFILPAGTVALGGSVPPELEVARANVAQQILSFITNLQNSQLSFFALIVLIGLTWNLLDQLETSLDDLWHVAKPRNTFYRLRLYLAIVFLAPLALITGLALTNLPLFTSARNWVDSKHQLSHLAWLTASGLAPMLISTMLLSFLFKLMPNMRISKISAIVGGLTAGFLWQANQMIGSVYITRVILDNAVYGGLGLLPFFMFNSYLCWLIILYGAQAGVVHQLGETPATINVAKPS
ncbi:MAG: YihY/virulence factor BrkB family protein [Pedosphaera sp.]|nr:YihY/virulence factor BrkB family protein [Pedosphaera sp.]